MYRKFILLVIAILIAWTVNAQSFDYITSDGSLGTTYSWIDCSPAGGGAEVQDDDWLQLSGLGTPKDDGYAMIAWPFAFQFYDSYYFAGDELSVCSNGFMRLDGIVNDNATDYYQKSITTANLNLGEIVSLAMEDCGFENSNSHLYYKTTGSSPNRVFTIEMKQIEVRFSANTFVDVQVSFYETSNIIVLKSIEGNIAFDAYMGIHSGNDTYRDEWQDLDTSTTDRWREYTPPPISFTPSTDLTITQASTEDLGPSLNNPIIRLKYDVYGGGGNLDLDDIKVIAVNSDNNDVGAVKLFYTNDDVFSVEHQVGSSVTISGTSYDFTGLDFKIPGGVSYFWVTYDINSTAITGNTVDAKINTGDINNGSGTIIPSTDQNPVGDRTISFFKWEGTSSTDWSTAANWSSNSLPTATGNVFIPSGTTYSPHLLTGNSGACKDLVIKTGATLTIENTSQNLSISGNITNDGVIAVTGTNNILLLSNDGSIEGSGDFSSARFETNSSSIYKLYNDIDINRITIDGTFNIGDYDVNCSNLFNLRAGSTLIVESGSISAVAALTFDGTFTAGTGTVIYAGDNNQVIDNITYNDLKIKVTGNSRTLTNVTNNFKNLEIYSEGGGTAIMNSDLTTDGNITVGANCTLDLGGNDITIKKEFTNNGSITFGTNTVTFSGYGAAVIRGSSDFYNLVINKDGGGVTIESGDIRVINSLTLTKGVVNASITPLVVLNSCTTTGGNSTSYVNGKLKKIGDIAYKFHVGSLRNYAPIEISAPSSATSEFTAQYYSEEHANSSVESPLTKVSEKEYWDLDNSGTAATVDVTLYWEDGAYSGIGDITDLLLAHYNGSNWESFGVNGTTGNISIGSITVNNVSDFSPFTLGTSNNITNPLPISLLKFNVEKVNKTAHINWSTASELNNSHFIIQRSIDGENVEDISQIAGAGNSNEAIEYYLIDSNPPKGLVYYRIKQVDYDGKSEIFDWKSVYFGFDERLNIYPIPNYNGELNFIYSDINTEAQVKIISIDGKIVFNEQIIFINGEAKINFDLPIGNYIVKTAFGNNMFISKLLVK